MTALGRPVPRRLVIEQSPLAVDPVRPNTIYVGTDGHGVLKTEDYGENWNAAGLDGQIVRSLAINSLRPGTIYAGTKPAHLYVTHDYGEIWQELPAFREMKRWYWLTPAEWPPSGYVMDIVLSPTNPDLVIVGIEAAGLLRSEDGGQTWTGHPDGAVRDCHDLTFHPTNGDWVYEGGGGSAAFSSDGGKTWSQPDPFNLWDALSQFVLNRDSPDSTSSEGKLDQRYGLGSRRGPSPP